MKKITEYAVDLSDDQVRDRYVEETRKLKMVTQWKIQGKQGKRPYSYNVGVMNVCKRELKRRGLPIPQVTLVDRPSQE
jgi:hypothetical protein